MIFELEYVVGLPGVGTATVCNNIIIVMLALGGTT